MDASQVTLPAPVPLVATKLEPPPLPRTYVERDRVMRLLALGAEEASELTLVSAPPGYGKTVAVCGWLARQDHPYGWLTLDAGDDDPGRLIRYLIAALRRTRPKLGPRTASVSGASGSPPVDVVIATLLDEIAVSDAPFVLVLDDYHLLASDLAQSLIVRLIAQAPPFAHVVLVTRQDPRIPLARLRAHGRIVEIRADDLRYTREEAAVLLGLLGVDLDPASVELLTERTEGWAAGIQLGALTLRGRPDAGVTVGSFGVANRYVIDYLADEVLESLSDPLRTFLERTSVADRLCGGLAGALTDRDDGDRMLRDIEGQNLFLLPLDQSHSWYRYHHLFGDYLRSRLDEADRRDCQFRAAAWCDRHGLTSEAATYALASERWPDAVPIVAKGARVALAAGEPRTVLRWTERLPASLLAESASLLADRGWAAFFTGQSSIVSSTVADLARLDVEGRLNDEAGAMAHAIMAWLAVLDLRPADGERLARLALESLGDEPVVRSLALLALADACWNLGRTEENAAALEEAVRLARAGEPTLTGSMAAYMYAVAAIEQGRRREAERTCRDLLASSPDTTATSALLLGPVRVALGMAAYEANDVIVAATELEAGFAMCRRLGVERVLGGESRRARAMTRLATAGPDAAAETVEEAIGVAADFLPRTRGPAAQAVSALVALRKGEARRAVRWAEAILADPGRDAGTTPKVRLHRDLAVASILLHSGAPSRAEKIAADAGRLATWAGSVVGQIQASIIGARAAEQGGRRADARERLCEAVSLAAPGLYIRRFVEDGSALAHLLPTVRSISEPFVDSVLEALDAETRPEAMAAGRRGSSWRTGDGAILELLTPRELDVLRLLAHGGSNASIARALGMSPGTAKWHVANVLGKLGATSRGEAAARARDLALV